MKKVHIIALIYILVEIAVILPLNALAPTNIHGEVRSMEQARRREASYYQDANILCTYEAEDCCVDFIFCAEEGEINILLYRRFYTWDVLRYANKFYFSHNIKLVCDKSRSQLEEKGDYDWRDVNAISEQSKVYWQWTVLDETCEIADDNISAYQFQYQDKEYTLYIKNKI